MPRKRKGSRRVDPNVLGDGAKRQIEAQGIDLGRHNPKEDANDPHKTDWGRIKGLRSRDQRTLDGIVFDSKVEMSAYRFLRDTGIAFRRQPSFTVQDGFTFQGKKYRPIVYIPDFEIWHEDRPDESILIDMKGHKTRDFMIKWKLMLKTHGRYVHRVTTLKQLQSLVYDNALLPHRNQANAQ